MPGFNCLCVSSCVTRSIVRRAYNIEGSTCGDLCWPCFCWGCAAFQALREVKARGTPSQNYPLIPIEEAYRRNQWSSGVCGCFDDCGSCCYACFCPSCAVASAASRYDGSNWCFNWLCKSPCATHNILRTGKYSIKGGCGDDICLPLCCSTCVAARMLREVKVRGPVNGGAAAVVPG
eukprot:TRINITY_DN12376_c0_g1_i1.p1 TRINITY_DN12376_c0_g1~~TRINITY_DN12376_c0_g1_i1.p1  ORF type:complete len:177 (-),score=6.53 TRINITY_DN12376_c0_g1_i1:504-1034(-)